MSTGTQRNAQIGEKVNVDEFCQEFLQKVDKSHLELRIRIYDFTIRFFLN